MQAAEPERRLIVVSHGIAGRLLRGAYAGLSREDTLAQDVPPGPPPRGAHAVSATATDAQALPAKAATSPHRVLYIEDNTVNALILSEWFRRRPAYILEVAEDGRTGLARAARWRPGLILLDMQLPDMDGLEVLHALHADPCTQTIPVVGLSAQTLGPEVAPRDRARLSGYLLKPLDFDALERVLVRILAVAPGV